VERLVAAGDRVTVFNRGVTPAALPDGVERIFGDRSDAGQLGAALGSRRWDAVVDTTLYTGDEARAIVDVLGGRVGHYVVLSTGQVYLVGNPQPPRPFREDDYDRPVMPEPPADHPDHEAWTYGVWKRDAEDVFAAAHAASAFPFTSLRLPMVNGERDHYGRIHGYLLRLMDGGPIVLPDDAGFPVRHVYASDVVDTVDRVIRSGQGKGRAFNVGQDETQTVEEFLEMLSGIAGHPLRIARAPREVLERDGLLRTASPFSSRWMSALDNRRGKDELGLTYTPVAEYVRRIVRHYLHGDVPAPDGYARRREELRLVEGGGTAG
jgi:nucleoside-diphosphate-sugar epimerase